MLDYVQAGEVEPAGGVEKSQELVKNKAQAQCFKKYMEEISKVKFPSNDLV